MQSWATTLLLAIGAQTSSDIHKKKLCPRNPTGYHQIRFIREARSTGGRVLVHCLCGVSRSVTIVGVVQYIKAEK